MNSNDATVQEIQSLAALSAKSVVEQYATQFPDEVAAMHTVRDACYGAVCGLFRERQFVRFCNNEEHVDVLVADLPSVPFGKFWQLLSEVPDLSFFSVTDIPTRCRKHRIGVGRQAEAFCESFPKIGNHVKTTTAERQAIEICAELETDESITWSMSQYEQMSYDSIIESLLTLMFYFEILGHEAYGVWSSFYDELFDYVYVKEYQTHPISHYPNPKLVIYIDDDE
jgi:hypothetical protein